MINGPVAVTRDDAVWAEAQRAAAAAGVEIDRTEDPSRLLVRTAAPLVLLDAALLADAARLADSDPLRGSRARGGRIVVLTAAEPTEVQWQACLALGVRRVLAVDSCADELVRLLADASADPPGQEGDRGGRGAGGTVAVLGACGGAGASVLAAATVLAAGRAGRSAVLCDLDPLGAGSDVVLGMEDVGGAGWGDIDAARGRVPAESLHQALPGVPGIRGGAVLSVLGRGRGVAHAPPAAVVATVLDATERAGEVAVVDLPRLSDPATDLALGRADVAVLVVPADVRGCYAAARVLPRLTALGATPELVVRGPSPGGIGAGDVADILQLPLLAAMRPQPGLERLVDSGGLARARPKGPLARAADAVVQRATKEV